VSEVTIAVPKRGKRFIYNASQLSLESDLAQ
jgi:hypothetical protein